MLAGDWPASTGPAAKCARAVSAPRRRSVSNGAIPSAPTKPGTKKLVIPSCAKRARPRRASSTGSPAGGGSSAVTRSCAPSCSRPFGCPSAPCSIRPSAGSGVAAVIPASASARELTSVVWPSLEPTTIGRCVGSASSTSLVRTVPDGMTNCWYHEDTCSQPSGSSASVSRRQPRDPRRELGDRQRVVVERAGVGGDGDAVDVAVLQAGHDHAAAQLHDGGALADIAAGAAVGADVDDPAAIHRDRLRDPVVLVGGVDRTAEHHAVGGARRRLGGGRERGRQGGGAEQGTAEHGSSRRI